MSPFKLEAHDCCSSSATFSCIIFYPPSPPPSIFSVLFFLDLPVFQMDFLGRFPNFSGVFSFFPSSLCSVFWKTPLKLSIETSFMQFFWISANLISQNTFKILNDPFKTYFVVMFYATSFHFMDAC